MSDIIQLLPDSIANQIAAGEVIQRPASVVKELLENSIDAQSTEIKLIVKDAGRTLIQVIDNGLGMSETDARMCFERHATSKIKSADDLFALNTMGFRGEAMASIAAIAQVEMRTRLHAQAVGTELHIEHSRVILQEPTACAAGTTISVKNLFFNVPARRNFLKSNTIEMRHLVDEFQRVAMAYPNIAFSLTHNGTNIFNLAVGNLRQRIVGILGKEYNQRLVPVQEATDVVSITGYVSKPEFAKKTRGEQFFFVNQRFIKSTYLNHAISTAFEALIARDSFPSFVLFINIDPARIDVNVHPTKQEIKFDDEKLIYSYLKVAVRYALGTNQALPSLDFDADNSFLYQNNNQNNSANINNENQRDSSNSPANDAPFRSKLNAPSSPHRSEENIKSRLSFGYNSTDDADNKNRERANLQNWQSLYNDLDADTPDEAAAPTNIVSKLNNSTDGSLLGVQPISLQKPPYQLHNKYIISHLKSGFFLIDQQAAHERILFEQFLDVLSEERVSSQQLLFPRTVTFSVSDALLFKDLLPFLNETGFDIREFGNSTFVLQGTPAHLPEGWDEQSVMENLLEQFKNNTDLHLNIREQVARTMAQQQAVKRGQELNTESMQHLIDELFACRISQQSPTGAKTYITYELNEIERLFS